LVNQTGFQRVVHQGECKAELTFKVIQDSWQVLVLREWVNTWFNGRFILRLHRVWTTR
jgi:DNA-binding HxlR family transcriptional regulator